MLQTKLLIRVGISNLKSRLSDMNDDTLKAVHFYLLWKDGCDEKDAREIAKSASRTEAESFLRDIFQFK